jgi:hypothetical protein
MAEYLKLYLTKDEALIVSEAMYDLKTKYENTLAQNKDNKLIREAGEGIMSQALRIILQLREFIKETE